jgi:hypothetical protein
MSSIRPETLTDRELLSGALLAFEPDTGMPIEWQKELIRRLASFLENGAVRPTDLKDSPDQLRLFD